MALFPSSAIEPQASVQTQNKPGLAERWRGWMSKPENAALLMQSGIAMLQPLQLGQSTAGAIASSIGQGFEARDRVRAGQQATGFAERKAGQEDRELNLREREGEARAKYYENAGGRGGVSASAIFRDRNADQARKQTAWMRFQASPPIGLMDASLEELQAAFEESWSIYNELEANAPVESAALPGLETPAASGTVRTATGPNGEKLQLVGDKWVPMK